MKMGGHFHGMAGKCQVSDCYHAHRIESDSLADGHQYTPSTLYSWLSTYMYNRRTKIKPLWNTIVVGGYHDNKPYVHS